MDKNKKIVKNKKKRPLYLEIFIGPTGFNWTEFRLLDKKPDVGYRTRGEGNCFSFKLVDYDCSTEMGDAISNGEIIKTFGNKTIEADLTKAMNLLEKKNKE